MEVGLGPGHIVRWGPSSPQQKGHSPQFLAHICCDQTDGWIKMPLGTEVGLDSGDNVSDGGPSCSLKRGTLPQFSAHVSCGQAVAYLSYC